MVIKCERLTVAIRIRTDFLRLSAVVVRLTGGWAIILSNTAVTVLTIFGTRRIARIKQRPLNCIVRVRVDTIPRLGWRRELQIPRTPALHERVTNAFLERDRKRGVGAQIRVGRVALSRQQRGGADTDGVCEVRWDIRERLVVGFWVQGYDAERDVVAVDEGDVVEGLTARSREGELGQSSWGRPLVKVSIGAGIYYRGWNGTMLLTATRHSTTPKQSPVLHAAPPPLLPPVFLGPVPSALKLQFVLGQTRPCQLWPTVRFRVEPAVSSKPVVPGLVPDWVATPAYMVS